MNRTSVIEDGLARHNAGRSVAAWGRTARAAEVDDLARRLGVKPAGSKAATLAAIARAPRPAVVDEGLSALTSGRSVRAWGRRVRTTEVSALARRLGVEPAGSKAATLDAIITSSRQVAVLANQAKVFPGVIEPYAASVTSAFDRARLKLFQDLATVTAKTAAGRMTAYTRAIQEWGRRLKAEMKRQLGRGEKSMHKLALDHMRELFGRKLSTAELDALRSMRQFDATVDKFLAEMAVRMMRQVTARIGLTPLGIARELAGPGRGSTLGGLLARAALIARMEALRAYNEAQVALARGLRPPKGRRVQKRIVEIVDPRNHPFSRAANGATAPVNQPFKVAVAAVTQEAAAMNKPASGVFWAVQDGHYVGMALPAHYNDRGRVVVELI